MVVDGIADVIAELTILIRQSNLHTYSFQKVITSLNVALRISARAAVGTGYFPKLVFPK